MITEVFSAISETNLKNRFASSLDSGINPTSSTVISAALRMYFSVPLLLPEISSVFRSIINATSVVKYAAYPRSNVCDTNAAEKCVFPIPSDLRKHMLCAYNETQEVDAA